MDRQAPLTSQTRFRLELPTTAFPFRRELSLDPPGRRLGADGRRARRSRARWPARSAGALESRARAQGAHRGSVHARAPHDISLDPDVARLPRPLTKDYGAAGVPFQLRAFPHDPGHRRLLLDDDRVGPGLAEPRRRGCGARQGALRLTTHSCAAAARHLTQHGRPARSPWPRADPEGPTGAPLRSRWIRDSWRLRRSHHSPSSTRRRTAACSRANESFRPGDCSRRTPSRSPASPCSGRRRSRTRRC